MQPISEHVISQYVRHIVKTKIIKNGPMNCDLWVMPIYDKNQFSWIARKYHCGRKLLFEVEDILPEDLLETVFTYDKYYELMYEDGIEHMKTCTPCRNSPKPGDKCVDCDKEFDWYWRGHMGNVREEFSQCHECWMKEYNSCVGKHVEQIVGAE